MKINYLFAIAQLVFSTNVLAQSLSESKTEQYFEFIKVHTNKLEKFLKAMPKGGDLHNHEAGASYAENMIKYAYHDNLCIDPITFVVSLNLHCESKNLLNHAIKNPEYYHQIIDAWSMRHFTGKKESGHDHFFSTFAKFDVIADLHRGEMLAEIAERAGLENESYLELMVTADGNESGRLGKKVGWDSDFNKMRAKLLAADFDKIINHLTTSLEADDAKMRAILACGTHQAKQGCNVKIRYLYQVLREQAREMVFAQLLAGFEAASKNKHIVGINLVQPEDGRISMRDYKLHMQMVGYLHQIYPDVHISLHAGELNNELVPHAGLRFHINDAVLVAHANRIGHGVDIINEDNLNLLLNKMANNHIMVEINLSSNAAILNVDGKVHPLPLYMHHGVAVSLSTDDEGISRTNLTQEYLHAVKTFNFNYLTLKTFVRNSLTYSFLPGYSLWMDDDYQNVTSACAKDSIGSTIISPICKSFLDKNEKAKMQWNLEARFNKFEASHRF